MVWYERKEVPHRTAPGVLALLSWAQDIPQYWAVEISYHLQQRPGVDCFASRDVVVGERGSDAPRTALHY